MRIRLLIVVTAMVLLGVALVAAQGEGPRSPNDATALEAETASGDVPAGLAAEAMAGRLPEDFVDVAPARSDLPEGIAVEEMAGRSPEDFAADTPAGNDLPEGITVEEMVGRSPEGDVVGMEPAAAVATDSAAATDGRGFLLTAVFAPGAAADSSCPAGYHMASLYEIADVTRLDYVRIPGQVTVSEDHLDGPPAGITGWVRTGYAANDDTTAGHANCNLWTTSAFQSYGTLVKLSDHWTDSARSVSPWHAAVWSCSGTVRVWCIED